MSGVGSKSGTPPIGHGPNAVVRSPKHNDDKKKHEQAKDQKEEKENKTGHDEFAVRMDASLYHLNTNDIIDGWVTKIESEERLVLDSQIGTFRLDGPIELAIGDQILINISSVGSNIDGHVTSAAGVKLEEPIEVAITPISLHRNAVAEQDGLPPSVNTAMPSTYAPIEQPVSNFSDISKEDAALIISKQSLGAHASHDVHPTEIKDTSHFANQNLSSIIEANAIPQVQNANVILNKKLSEGHDTRPSLDLFFDSYANKHPENIDELKRLINGQNNLVPSGMAFFFAGLIFKDVKTWLSPFMYSQMEGHPALKALDDDFQNLIDHIHCLANENWRLMVLRHPQGGESRAIHIISNIQSGQAQDGSKLDMRTILTQLNFRSAPGYGKPFGQIQIEGTLMPQHCGLTLRFSRDISEQEKNDIERMVNVYFIRAGLNGHVLFTTFSSGHTDFQDIVNELSLGNPAKNLST